ncbi:MAG: NfeD family protein [Phycisphaerales bacterium]
MARFARWTGWVAAAAAAVAAMAVQPPAADDPAAAPSAVPAWRQASDVAIVPVHGEFDAVLRTSVQRRIGEAVARGADAVVLELDTPGGDMYATLELCLWLKDRAPVPVWAWVRPKAYSAGAIIALACRGILVSPGAAFGDAAPIAAIPGLGLQPLPVAERAKLEAPVLSDVVDSARRNGYDETVVRAFVSAPDEVWMLERTEGGERIFVGRTEYRDAFGADPPVTRGGGAPARAAVEGDAPMLALVDRSMRAGRRGADGPSTPDERDAMVEEQQVRPPVRARLAPQDAAGWAVVAQVDGAEELLVVQAQEAAAFGLAQRTVADERELGAWFGATTIERLDEHAGDALVRFLTSWPVRIVLVILLLGGFLLEMMAPGVSWPGITAAIAFALLVGAPALAGVAEWWPFLVVLAGIGLVLVEVFLVPGIGVAGVLGVACVLVGLVGSFLGAPLDTPQGRSDLATGIGTVAGGLIVAIGAAWVLLRVVPQSRVVRGITLQATAGGAPVAEAPRDLALPARGARGRALTPLRPSGKAEFAGQIHDVQAVGAMVEAGAEVTVVRASGYSIEVEAT